MEKTLMLLCPFGSSQSFLFERFPKKDIRVVTSMGGVFPWSDKLFLSMLEDLIVSEKIKSIYLVQDLHSRFLTEGIHEPNSNTNETTVYISKIYLHHQVEITAESELSKQISKLALYLIEDQVNQLFGQASLHRITRENKITVKGMLSNQSRAKSMEFQVQPELQFS
jgi:cellobiose-specific phosphotransferase system component IIB